MLSLYFSSASSYFFSKKSRFPASRIATAVRLLFLTSSTSSRASCCSTKSRYTVMSALGTPLARNFSSRTVCSFGGGDGFTPLGPGWGAVDVEGVGADVDKFMVVAGGEGTYAT
uniref:(northern house mosquito) hypothetical protein n=1 Tax=Culex pipiens TaxID=7175 RepID=A0A8D8AXE6_CULPI